MERCPTLLYTMLGICKNKIMEELVKQMGFESVEEFHKLNATPDLSDPETMKKYLDWKENDGTKEGLLKVIA